MNHKESDISNKNKRRRSKIKKESIKQKLLIIHLMKIEVKLQM